MIVHEVARYIEKILTADYADSTDKSFEWVPLTLGVSPGKTIRVIRVIRG